MRRNSLTHVARGADGVLFFQWRASRAGAEKFHSAMLPHAGTDTQVWREVVRARRDLRALADVAGQPGAGPRSPSSVDWTSWWAVELDSHPLDLDSAQRAARWLRRVLAHGTSRSTSSSPAADLPAYRLVVVPLLYLVERRDGRRPRRRSSERGGHRGRHFFCGIVDEHDHIRLGGYPGALRDLLGVRIEEFFPLGRGAVIGVGDGLLATLWSERVNLSGAEAVLTMGSGPDRGHPALTRHQVGGGAAWYLATQLDAVGMSDVLDRVLAGAGVDASRLPPDVKLVRRTCADIAYTFVINHGVGAVEVQEAGVDVLAGVQHPQGLSVPGGGVAVLLFGAPTVS